MKWLKKFFCVDTEVKTARASLIKILICLLILLAMFFRYRVFGIQKGSILDTIIFICLVPLVFLIGFAVQSACYELMELSTRKEREKHRRSRRSVSYSISEIQQILCENDIIEFALLRGDTTVIFGASAECDNSGSFYDKGAFYNKQYYIEKQEFSTIETVLAALKKLVPATDAVPIAYIDGCAATIKQKNLLLHRAGKEK